MPISRSFHVFIANDVCITVVDVPRMTPKGDRLSANDANRCRRVTMDGARLHAGKGSTNSPWLWSGLRDVFSVRRRNEAVVWLTVSASCLCLHLSHHKRLLTFEGLTAAAFVSASSDVSSESTDDKTPRKRMRHRRGETGICASA